MTALELIKLLGTLVGIMGGCIGVISLLYTAFRNKKSDDKELIAKIDAMRGDGIENGVKLTQAINGIADMRVDVKTIDGRVQNLSERSAVNENNIKLLTTRIAEIEDNVAVIRRDNANMQEEINSLKKGV